MARLGKRERTAMRSKKLDRDQTINRNLSNPIERVFGRLPSSCARDTLLGGTHTMGFHSSSIRGHKASGTARSQRWARDGFKD